jgi:Fic family protein
VASFDKRHGSVITVRRHRSASDAYDRRGDRAIEGAQTVLATVLEKARFWQFASRYSLNERQRLVLNRVLEGFEGKLTTSKWAKLAKCSQDTALRDIQPLVEAGILIRSARGGRSTSYVPAQIGETLEREELERKGSR